MLAISWSCAQTAPSPPRDPAWAEPVEAPGLPNLHRVSERLYRSAQPTAEGMRSAEALGIKTIINLRGFHSDDELAPGVGLNLVRHKIHTWAMDREDILEGLRLIETSPGPVLVHCQHGADRTGTLLAAYRMVAQGWTREAALREMTEGGYGYHSIWGNLLDLLKDLDIAAMREQLGRLTGRVY